MKQLRVGSFRDLMNGELSGTIQCGMRGVVVRRLKLSDDGLSVEIDAMTQKVWVPLDTPIIYERWFMDRGSLLFNESYKICTELDTITFLNGESYQILPKVI